MRGTQRRVIYLKNTGSDVFDEAYFVIREGVVRTDPSGVEEDLIKEANRIINEHIGNKKIKKSGKMLFEACLFLTGFTIAFFIASLIL